MSPARWTASPLAAREAEEAARDARRAELRVGLAVAALASTCPLGLAITATGTLGWLLTVGLVAGAVALLDRASELRKEARGALWDRDAVLVDELGARDGWLVDLIVHAGDAPLGSDRGMLWVEDGRLYFAGARTSFALTPEQASRCEEGRAVPGLRHGLRVPLRVGPAERRDAVSFSPVRGAKGQSRTDEREVADALDRWMREGRASGGQLPPRVPAPDAPDTARLVRGAVASTLFWLAVVAGLVSVWPLGLAGLLLGRRWHAVRGPRLRWRALADRRRLDRRRSG